MKRYFIFRRSAICIRHVRASPENATTRGRGHSRRIKRRPTHARPNIRATSTASCQRRSARLASKPGYRPLSAIGVWEKALDVGRLRGTDR